MKKDWIDNIVEKANAAAAWLWIIFLLLALVSFCSCTPQKRLSRLLKQHPELIQQQDTAERYDTVIIDGFRVDTLFYPQYGKRDTFIINTGQSFTRVYLNETKTEARVDQEHKADTIINTTRIIEKYLPPEDKNRFPTWALLLLTILAGFGLAAVCIYIDRNFKIT